MVYITRGKRKLKEAEGRVVVLKDMAFDIDQLIRSLRKKTKRQKEEEASTYQFFNVISADLKRHILSFVRQIRYVILASVSRDFRSILKSMPDNDFKTHCCTYIWRWKLTKWILCFPNITLIPSAAKTIVHAIKYDVLHVFRNLIKRNKWRKDWKRRYALNAVKYNSMQILKWIIHDQGWDYKAHKNAIVSSITYCNHDMLGYLHETLHIDFNNFEAIESMIMKPSVPDVDAIRYVLDVVPTMTILQRTRLVDLCISKVEDIRLFRMLREKLYDSNEIPDMFVRGVSACCEKRKSINIVKGIIDKELAKQMKERQKMAVRFGRLDIVMYLQEEVFRIRGNLNPWMQHARAHNHRDLADYLAMVMDRRRD